MTSESITVRVPGKLNIYLQAGALRDDGYHEVTTVYQTISIFDTLVISRLKTKSSRFTIHTSGTGCELVPHDDRNLVVKAARLLLSRGGIQDDGHCELIKAIPVEAGLGGGSADAAAALVGCNLLWKIGLGGPELESVASQIGEDVPFFLKGSVAIGYRCMRLMLGLECKYPWYWVLGVLEQRLSARKVYDKFEELLKSNKQDDAAYRARHIHCLQRKWGQLLPQDLASAGVLVNDLEEAAIALLPDVGRALQAGRNSSALASILAGSGSSCAFLARDEAHAQELVGELEQSSRIFKDLIVVKGPVEDGEIARTSRTAIVVLKTSSVRKGGESY